MYCRSFSVASAARPAESRGVGGSNGDGVGGMGVGTAKVPGNNRSGFGWNTQGDVEGYTEIV